MSLFKVLVNLLTVLSCSYQIRMVQATDNGVGNLKFNINVKTNITEIIIAEIKELRAEIFEQRQKQQQIENDNKIMNDFFKELLTKQIENMRTELLALQKQEFERLHNKMMGNFENSEQKLSEQSKAVSENISQQISKLELGQSTLKVYAADILNGRVSSDHWNQNFNCTEGCSYTKPLPQSCEEAMEFCHSNGVYLLKIPDTELPAFYANCKCIENEVWTIIQRREDGSVNFYRDWKDYKHGFGNLYGEMWLGLERIHQLTKRQPHELNIWMRSKNGTEYFARYKKFEIADEDDYYKLTVGNFSGKIPDNLEVHNGLQFSTRDGGKVQYCATEFQGAWWFTNCYASHLNGLYSGENTGYKAGIAWNYLDENLKFSQMAIRRINFANK